MFSRDQLESLRAALFLLERADQLIIQTNLPATPSVLQSSIALSPAIVRLKHIAEQH
jgi:hypothetical protein